ncbi:RNA polymerase II-associated factor 1 [Trichostrongylus colubriformis]|uniref:RNA polymerase II-associated factor 1 homolog n=1 Tax=Trichostrongylus colubriformis TaxID=6319 RepID=A0AAN8IPY2_TRICO
MSQPNHKPNSGKHKSRGPDFICKPRFRNTLPDVPFPGKFLPCPFVELERFIDYKPTSLEMEYKFEVQCEMDIGLNLDLIDPNTYKVDNSSEIQLNEKDALLLEDEDSNAKQIKRSAQHSKVVPWMRKTQYISSEFNRFGVAADRQEIKVGYNLTKNKENLNIFRDRQSQINLITKSFEDSKVPIRKHFSKKGVTALEEIPILPDFTLWKYPFAVVQFDVDPTPTSFAPELCDSMVTQSYIKGMQDDDGEQFVAHFIPTVETLQKKLNDKEEGRDFEEGAVYEHILNREYTWTVKNKNTKGFERDNYFVYYKDGCFYYNELETKVRLARRRRAAHDKPNTRLNITYTTPTEVEMQQMTNRVNSLLRNYDSDDEGEGDKASEKSGGEEVSEKEGEKKDESDGSGDSNSEKEESTDNEKGKDGRGDDGDSDSDNKKSASDKDSTDESD